MRLATIVKVERVEEREKCIVMEGITLNLRLWDVKDRG